MWVKWFYWTADSSLIGLVLIVGVLDMVAADQRVNLYSIKIKCYWLLLRAFFFLTLSVLDTEQKGNVVLCNQYNAVQYNLSIAAQNKIGNGKTEISFCVTML